MDLELLQTYETTIIDSSDYLSATFFVIPARSLRSDGHNPYDLQGVAAFLSAEVRHETTFIDPNEFVQVLVPKHRIESESPGQPINRPNHMDLAFANYVANARVVPFERSPLGAESLSSIAASSVKAGTITLGATVGYLSAGPTPFLLVAVPLGIVLCGASVSMAKWLEENRNRIWNRLLRRF